MATERDLRLGIEHYQLVDGFLFLLNKNDT